VKKRAGIKNFFAEKEKELFNKSPF